MTDDHGGLAHLYEAREAHAQYIAQLAVRRYTEFRSLPDRDTAGVLMLGYGRRIEHDRLTQQEADFLLLNDIKRVTKAMRELVFPLMRINEVRMAVLFHLAFVLGSDTLKAMTALWDALRIQDYDTAADVMLLSDWPTRIGHDDAERRRAVDLVRMMRTGVMKKATP